MDLQARRQAEIGSPTAISWNDLHHDTMATIYRKTEKGHTEIETRRFRLLPRMRTALILVDGHRHDLELAKLIPGDPAAALQSLLGDGFIEVLAVAEQRPGPRAGVGPAGADTAGRITDTRLQAFEQRKRDAIRVLNDQLGPGAEALAIRMEKSGHWDELLPILRQAQQILRNTRGAATAAEYSTRFIDTPLA